jgi:outer membrane protein
MTPVSSARRALIGAAVLAAAVAGPSAAQQPDVRGELSLEQAVARAREHNPDLLAQRNDVQVADAGVAAAVSEFLPTISTGVNFGWTASGERRSGSVVLAQQPSVYSSSFAVSMGYTVSGARLYATRAARQERQAVGARVAGREAELASEVTQRYVAALQAAEQVDLAAREVARANEHLASARDRLAAGQITALEVRRAEVQVGRAEIRGVRAASAYATSLLGLGRAMGGRVDPAVRLSTRPQVFEPRWDAPDLVSRALARNASLAVAAASVSSAATRVRVARAGYYPTLSLSVGMTGWKQLSDEDALVRQRLGAGAQDPAVEERVRREVREQNRGFPFAYNRQPLAAALSLQFPVFQGLGRAQQVRQARAAAEDARLQLRSEELRVEEEVTTALLDIRAAFDAAAVAARVRDTADEELAMARERFRLGLANSLAVLDAQGHLSEAEQEQSTAAFDFHRALARLRALVGEPLP